MTKYLLLFRGGMLGRSEQTEEQIKSWDTWVEKLAHEGRFISGLPFGPNAKIVTGPEKVITNFVLGMDDVAEYIVIQATDMDEAVELAKGAPNLQYGGSVEIRSTIPPAQ